MAKHDKFAKGSAAYHCEACGKLTRETGSEESTVQLCKHCYLTALAANAASDYGEGSPRHLKALAALAGVVDPFGVAADHAIKPDEDKDEHLDYEW